MAVLICARREHTYEIEAATLLLASKQWIPVEGVHELPLVQALVDAKNMHKHRGVKAERSRCEARARACPRGRSAPSGLTRPRSAIGAS